MRGPVQIENWNFVMIKVKGKDKNISDWFFGWVPQLSQE